MINSIYLQETIKKVQTQRIVSVGLLSIEAFDVVEKKRVYAGRDLAVV